VKSIAVLTICFLLPILRAQEFAPNSVGDMVYSVRRTFPPAGFSAIYAAILSVKGIYTPFNYPGSPSLLPGPFIWTKTGANAGTLVLSGAPSASRHELVFTANGQGAYRETIPSTGAVIVGEFLLAAMPNGQPPSLSNLSSRATLFGSRLATLGFVVEGPAPRRVLVRAIGPSLAQFGVANPVANPALTVFRGPTQIAANTGWSGASDLAAVFTKVGAFALPAASRDSAVVLTLEPGSYTAHARADIAGEVLLEVYFVD
jgi:hypothetical protein